MKDCDPGPKNETAAGTRLKLREPRPDLLVGQGQCDNGTGKISAVQKRKNIQSRGFLI